MPEVYDEDRFQMTTGAAITDQATAAAAPTQAEFNSLVGKFNALLVVCRERGLIAQD